jgi:hypothetical protein
MVKDRGMNDSIQSTLILEILGAKFLTPSCILLRFDNTFIEGKQSL